MVGREETSTSEFIYLDLFDLIHQSKNLLARMSSHEVFAVFWVRQNGLETYEVNLSLWI